MKSIYYIITLLVGLMIFNGCETDQNGPMPDTFEEGGVAYMVIDESSSGLINVNDLASFTVSGTIDMMFDVVFDKLTLMVGYNGQYDNAGILVDNISALPATFSFNMNDVISALPQLSSGDDIQISDYFVFYVNTTIGGKEYPIYKVIGGTGVRTVNSGIIKNLTALKGADAITDIRIDVPCGFDPDGVVGDYIAYSGPWIVNGPVTITADPADPFIVYVDGLPELDGIVGDVSTLKMVIDPNSYNVSVDKQILGSDAWGVYHDFAYAGAGKLNTCNGVYSMDFDITVEEGSFGGPFPFTLTPVN